ncbi:MAG: CHASE2 domain-containing protein [Deltaproteobacteria bacterium]|nr:CHASE2 domain-containing protein [Deltaproteobacteria bacterium]
MVSALVTVLHGVGYFESLEAKWLDAMGMIFRPSPSAQVVAVAVTDADFARPDLFGSISPLHPDTLRRLVERLAQHRPAVVALDILLQPVPHESADRAAARQRLYQSLASLAAHESTQWVLIEPDRAEVNLPGIDAEVQAAWEVLRSADQATPPRVWWASPTMHVEEGSIRRMPLAVVGNGAHAATPTLLGAVVEARAAAPAHAPQGQHESVLIRYTGAFALDASAPITAHAISAGDLLAPAGGPRDATLLTGKTVIVGGTHEAGRDYHWTPIGRIAAVQIWAEAVDAWLRHDAPREPPRWLAFVLETAVGVGGGWLMLRFSPLVGYILTVVALAPLTLLLSSLAFGAGVMFINFLPSFFAVRLHQRFELTTENRALRRELQLLQARAESRQQDAETAAHDDGSSERTLGAGLRVRS